MPKVSKAHLARRRQQILDAAIACFARKGFHQTTMADIAAEAGVSDTLAYRYFSGKEALVRAAMRERSRSSADDLAHERGKGVEDFRALVDLLLSSGVRRFEHQPDIHTVLGVRFRSWAEALENDDVRDEVLTRWRHHIDVAEGLITRAQQQGQITAALDAPSVARVMLAMHDGLDLQAMLDPDIDLEACKAVMLAMSFGGFWIGPISVPNDDE